MGVLSFTLVRPSAVLCASLVLLIFLFPETCIAGGKKMIPPVKHLFGVGIGYQKVVHYKPVLVISKSRRMKNRPSGWGWKIGRGGVGGHKYTPVVVQEGKRGYAHGHSPPPPPPHRRKRKRPTHHHPHPRPHSSGGRGWGWQRGWRRPHRSHRKGHDGENQYMSIDMHQQSHNNYHGNNGGGMEYHRGRDSHENQDSGEYNNYHRSRSPPESSHQSQGGGGGYDNPRNRSPQSNRYKMGGDGGGYHEISEQPSPTPHHYEISDHPSSVQPYYEDGIIIAARPVNGHDRPMSYPLHSSNYYGSPYSSQEDTEEDHGGYESEIREQWKIDDVPTTPSSDSSTSTISPSPTPPLYPFTDHSPPQSDGSVTNMHKDFLKTHMKNFHQFQDYQQATTNHPKQHQQQQQHHIGTQFAPYRLRAPGPFFSTMDSSSSSEGEERGNDFQYEDDDPYDDKRNNGGEVNYDDDYNGTNELHRKMMPVPQSTQTLTTIKPTALTNSMNIKSNSNMHPTITTMPKNDKKFKPSPRVDEIGSGTSSSFNQPGFFPTLQKFNKQSKPT